jgi:uncharacterized protein (TIGR03000 family)
MARVAVLAVAALLSSAGLGLAAGHGGGGHRGGGGHGGEGHHHDGFHHGSNVFIGVGLGGWGWGYPWGYYGDYYPRYYGGYYPAYGGYYSPDYGVPANSPAQFTSPSVAGASTFSSLAGSPAALSATPDPNAIFIRVQVPADAEVWLEGQKTAQTGRVRFFESPPVAPGRKYVYHIRARWNDGGHIADEVREATVSAGAYVIADFTQRQWEKAPPPRAAD